MNKLAAIRQVFTSELGPTEKLVALAILDHVGGDGQAWPSVGRLAAHTSLGRRTVLRILAKLEAEGRLSVVRQGQGRGNLYRLDWCHHDTGATTALVPQRHLTSATMAPELVSPWHPKQSVKQSGTNQRGPTSGPSPTGRRVKADGAATKRRWTRCPAGWQPNETHREIARKQGLDVEAEAEKFRDHEFAKPKVDPDATFRNWLRQDNRWGNRRQQPLTQPNAGRWKPKVANLDAGEF